MAKRTRSERVTTYTDETIVIPPGDTKYWILADEDEIEKLASGRTPRRIMEQAYAALSWKREAAQDWDSYQPEKKAKTA